MFKPETTTITNGTAHCESKQDSVIDFQFKLLNFQVFPVHSLTIKQVNVRL